MAAFSGLRVSAFGSAREGRFLEFCGARGRAPGALRFGGFFEAGSGVPDRLDLRTLGASA